MQVTSMVKPILIKMAFTFLFKLPGMSPGAFKNTPTTTDGAHSAYPKIYIITKGVTTAVVSLIPLYKLEPLKNSSTLFKCLFNMYVLTNKDTLIQSIVFAINKTPILLYISFLIISMQAFFTHIYQYLSINRFLFVIMNYRNITSTFKNNSFHLIKVVHICFSKFRN